MKDNIGGIVRCYYTFVENVEKCAITSRGIHIRFKEGKDFYPFPSTKERNEIQVAPANDKLGTYTVQGSVSIPTFNEEKDPGLSVINNQAVILMYENGKEEQFVVGDLENFVTANVQKLSPTPASGYSGLKISFSATLTHPELLLL